MPRMVDNKIVEKIDAVALTAWIRAVADRLPVAVVGTADETNDVFDALVAHVRENQRDGQITVRVLRSGTTD